jgi:protein-S-isoprenylcysteine O-methyltransferase Ste14
MPTSRTSALGIAWGGAVLFAASLLWFLYCYLVRYGQAAQPRGLLSPVLANLGLFSVFALHHSLLARSGAKRRIEAIVSPALERSLYTWVASVMFIAVCAWWQPVPGTLYALDGGWKIAGWGVQALGVLLTLRASHALDMLELAGVRAAAGISAERRPLTTRGLYGIVRHPLYLAWALFVFGTPTMTGTRASFAIISVAYLMLAIPWEERGLVQTFGREYDEYCERVRSRMIPGVY